MRQVKFIAFNFFLLLFFSCNGTYEAQVTLFKEVNSLSDEWVVWMMDYQGAYSQAYSAGQGGRRVRVRVVYDEEIDYDPPWSSEAEHMAALETMAELQFPGWDFTFSLTSGSITAVIGYTGSSSYADLNTNTVYLIYEGIFAHEYGHLLGLLHHYCDNPADTVNCGYLPPDEEACIMSRDAVSWGITERFLLGLSEGDDDAINAAISNINDRYPSASEDDSDSMGTPYVFGN